MLNTLRSVQHIREPLLAVRGFQFQLVSDTNHFAALLLVLELALEPLPVVRGFGVVELVSQCRHHIQRPTTFLPLPRRIESEQRQTAVAWHKLTFLPPQRPNQSHFLSNKTTLSGLYLKHPGRVFGYQPDRCAKRTAHAAQAASTAATVAHQNTAARPHWVLTQPPSTPPNTPDRP